MGIFLLDSAVNATQLQNISTALTTAAGTILDTFIGLLPIIALIVGVSFAIRYVSRKFNELKKSK